MTDPSKPDRWVDPIVEEVRVERAKLLEESGGTLEGIFALLRAQQQGRAGRRVVAPPAPRSEQDQVGAA